MESWITVCSVRVVFLYFGDICTVGVYKRVIDIDSENNSHSSLDVTGTSRIQVVTHYCGSHRSRLVNLLSIIPITWE